ncbi:MAG: ABC transporter substrate-binding protein [Chloroflexota bacterium]
MTKNMTLTNRNLTTTDAENLDTLIHRAPATDDLLQLADWLASNGADHLSAIGRIELAERLITRRRFLIGAGALVLAGCGLGDEAAAPTAITETTRKIIDDLSRSIEVPAMPQRIVVMSQQFIELATALDIVIVGAGVSGFEINGETLKRLPYLDRDVPGAPQTLNLVEPSIEAITALNPDLIITPPIRDPAYEVLLDIAPTLYFNPSTDWRPTLHKFAEAVGRTTQAEQVIDDYDDDIAAWREETAPLVEQAPEVMLILLHTEEQVFVMNEDAPAGRVLGSLGFRVVVPEGVQVPENGVAPVSVEVLADLTTDVIITTGATGPLDPNHPALPLFESLDTPVGLAPLPAGIGNAGPYSDRIFIDVFVEAIRSVLT